MERPPLYTVTVLPGSDEQPDLAAGTQPAAFTPSFDYPEQPFTIEDDVTFGRLCQSMLKSSARGKLPVGKTVHVFRTTSCRLRENGRTFAGLIELDLKVRILREVTA